MRAAVRDAILANGYSDLASQPRFLQHMLDLAASSVPLKSRRGILERVAAIYLARMDTRRVPASCTEEALERIAWEIQMGRDRELQPEQLVRILDEVRRGREFALGDLLHALVNECRLLVPNGDEGVRFTYPVMQAYFAARYLAGAPDRPRLVEDITASLGRLARLRRWQRVLVLAATMVPDPTEILHAVLAGSSLMEGDQLFLAVRCYQEVVAERGSNGRPRRGRRPDGRHLDLAIELGSGSSVSGSPQGARQPRRAGADLRPRSPRA